MEKNSFVFFKSFYESINALPEEMQLEVYKAVCEYGLYGKEPEKNGIAKALFTSMKPNIDSSARKYEASIENGKRGGRPKKNEEKENPEKPNKNLKKPNHNPAKPKGNLDKPNQNLDVDVDVDEDVDEDVNEDKNKESKKESKKTFDELIDDYTTNDELREELRNHLATRKKKKATLTNRAIELSLMKLNELVKSVPVNEQEGMKLNIVRQSIEKGWTGFFPIQQNYNYQDKFKNKKSDGWSYLDEELNKIKNENNLF